MAEFQEVARHWKRMCKKYWTSTSCHGCPIAEYEKGYEACSAYESDVAKMEELVMSWAEEHPEPVYPTWYEFMRENKIIPDVLEDCGDYYKTIGKWLVKATIKQDIAQKLGIEPKEV